MLAAAGLGNTGADVFGRGGPYLERGAADLVASSQLLDEYSPEIFCTIRNYHDIAPKVYAALGDNGYSLGAHSAGGITLAPPPYFYPENLPLINAKGGPGGRPGCWQPITRELWPAPYLVMDTGASMAPYNHFELGPPLVVDYVWGRQLGDYTINPQSFLCCGDPDLGTDNETHNDGRTLICTGVRCPLGACRPSVRGVLNRNQIELMCRAYANSDGRWLVNPMFIDPLPMSPPYPCATEGFDQPNGDQAPLLLPDGSVVPDQQDRYTEESFATERDVTPLQRQGCRQMSEKSLNRLPCRGCRFTGTI